MIFPLSIKPILVNRYSAYVLDIKPLGFKVLEMEGYVTPDVLDEINHLIDNRDSFQENAENNFCLASRFFSYEVLRRKLRNILTNFEGIRETMESNH